MNKSTYKASLRTVSVLITLIGLLAGCGFPPVFTTGNLPSTGTTPESHEATPEPPPAPPSAIGTTPVTSSPMAMLEIGGLNSQRLAATLDTAIAEVQVEHVLNQEAWDQVRAGHDEPVYLKYALVGQPGPPWTLYYVQPPTGIITPTLARMHAVDQASDTETLVVSGPSFPIVKSVAISTTADSTTLIGLEQGIELIRQSMGFTVPPGQVLAGRTAFLVLSNGSEEEPRYSAVILTRIQPNSAPLAPGDDTDPMNYCQTCVKCKWWCWFA